MQKQITVRTSKKREIVDITSQVERELSAQGEKVGLVHLFIRHTTAALTTADLDPGTDKDFLEMLERMTPDLNFLHPHDPKHAPDHIWAGVIGPEVTIPAKEGKLVLGTWQRIVLVELDGPRERSVWINMG